jgi:hypothetical protein
VKDPEPRPPELALDAVPPPWDYNPSAWSQRIPICVLATIAAGIAFYMSAFQWGVVPTVWDPVFGDQTDKVLSSDVAKWMHFWFVIPDAALGAIAYLGDAVFGLAGSTRRWQYRPWLVIVFGIDVIPLGLVSVVLVVLQGTVVGEWCFLCLVTAVISLILVYFAYDEVLSCVLYLWKVWTRTRSPRILWSTFWGRPTVEGAEVAEDFLRGRQEAATSTRARTSNAFEEVPWSRVCEILIGAWLLASPFAFGHSDADVGLWATDLVCGGLVILFAVAAMLTTPGRAHYLSLVVVAWLVGFAYFSGAYPASAARQNELLTGLVLVLFVVLPTRNIGPPREWASFRSSR